MENYDIYECPQCNNKITLPRDMDEEDRTEITCMCRSGRKIETMALLRNKFNFGLSECKVMMVHISDPQNHCANCGNKLLETGVTYCSSCSGLNLNW